MLREIVLVSSHGGMLREIVLVGSHGGMLCEIVLVGSHESCMGNNHSQRGTLKVKELIMLHFITNAKAMSYWEEMKTKIF